MSTEKKIVSMKPRKVEPCRICGAKNTDTRELELNTMRGERIILLHVCRSCFKQLILQSAEAWFYFQDTEPAKAREDAKA